MDQSTRERRWLWATLLLSSISIVAVVFAFWELVENHLFRDLDYVKLHYLYISRGISSSLLLSLWAAWFVMQQRRKAEAALRRSRERYRGIINASPNAVVLYDSDLVVSEWNPAAERLFGITREQAVGNRLSIVPDEQLAELEQFLRAAAAGERVVEQETVRCDAGGRSLDVQVSLLPFREAGRTLFLEIDADIRERVRMRRMLLEVEKLTSMGKMAAGTAHHLNTPLASMLLRVQMMRGRAHDDAPGGDLERLEKSIIFCQQFVRRLLDFTRMPGAQREPEEIAGIVQAVASFLEPSFRAKKVALRVDTDDAHRECVMADRNQLETVLLSLLGNALDAVNNEGEVRVTCRRAGEAVEVAVTDNGCGIPPADLERIFEPFFTTKPTGKGTGLGLSIAQHIVSEHGGKLSMESEIGRGTTARFLLPVCPAAAVAGVS